MAAETAHDATNGERNLLDFSGSLVIPAGTKLVLPDGTTRIIETSSHVIFVPEGESPDARDPTQLRIKIQASSMPGGHAYLWTQIDTGSAANLITTNLVKTLENKGCVLTRHDIGDEGWQAYMTDKTVERRHRDIKADRLTCANGGELELKQYISLSFEASGKQFDNEIFELLPEDTFAGEDSASNDQPDLIFGAPWLTEHSVLMIDPAFQLHDDATDFDTLEPRLRVGQESGCRPLFGHQSTKDVRFGHQNSAAGLVRYR